MFTVFLKYKLSFSHIVEKCENCQISQFATKWPPSRRFCGHPIISKKKSLFRRPWRVHRFGVLGGFRTFLELHKIFWQLTGPRLWNRLNFFFSKKITKLMLFLNAGNIAVVLKCKISVVTATRQNITTFFIQFSYLAQDKTNLLVSFLYNLMAVNVKYLAGSFNIENIFF